MKLYKKLNKRQCRVSVKKINIDKLSDIVKEWLANSERRRREALAKKEAVRMKQKLKEQAAASIKFDPYKPKIATNGFLKTQSSVSVLQSFTSAVQQLCSPKKNGVRSRSPTPSSSRNGGTGSNSAAVPTGSARRRAMKRPLIELDDVLPMIQSKNKVQCIDLCSSSDDDESESASR